MSAQGVRDVIVGGGPEAQQFGLENAPEVINKWAGELLTTSGHGGRQQHHV